MSIFDKYKEHQAEKTFRASNDEAIKIFDAQKDAIKGISNTTGYKAIKKYFDQSKDNALARVMAGDNAIAKAQYTLADEFLKFLASRES